MGVFEQKFGAILLVRNDKTVYSNAYFSAIRPSAISIGIPNESGPIHMMRANLNQLREKKNVDLLFVYSVKCSLVHIVPIHTNSAQQLPSYFCLFSLI